MKTAVLVTIQGPDRRADLDLPADRTVGELLPELVRLVDAEAAEGTLVEPLFWALGPPGGRPYHHQTTLGQEGVLDGAILELKPATAWRESEPIPASTPPAALADDGLTPRQRTDAMLPSQAPVLERLGSALHAATTPNRTTLGAPAGPLAPGTPVSPGRLTVHAQSSLAQRVRDSWRETDYLSRLDRAIASPQLRRCVTIAVVSPKGGVGKTTISALLGTLLAMVRRDRIVAIDTNPDFGSLGRTLAPDHDVFVDDLLKILDSPHLTVTELDARLGRTAHGLMVLPAPTDPARMARIDEAAYTRVVQKLQDMVGVVVLDCGTGLQEPASRAALKAADEVVLVTDAEPATASLVVEAGTLLSDEGMQIWLALNKMPNRGARLDIGAIERFLPQARGMVEIPAAAAAANRLPAGSFDWRDAPASWQRSIRELAAALVADWSRLGAAGRA